MEKKAVIKIVSNATMENGELIEVVTPGSLKSENEEIIALYKETEISGMDGTDTKLRIGGDYVVLEREGSTSTKMHFQKDKQSICLYNTPYGMLELTIDTKGLEIDMNEDGGKVEIKYEMQVADQPAIKTQLKLDIKA
ncbi:DUF1934 domain-containing protein [Eubacterium multiforme]|uniref:Uncharacterized beta-barrel protein YwiB (DUF1934 family) n=1 Tax=Eubacterium multiforme TaxID=83339 RepID=A0ABT9URX3_9FIRM|nr:DUF1934 domain-containing protein [Eubacterium multiforme]MDQ0148834.1 uncharacterized beta-barrel protein YwiB (DUF1934 family) [Eubacterium multiforme]